MSLVLESTARPIRVRSVEPVADPGLRVTYLGYSSCQRGCVGAGPWNGEYEQRAKRGIDGTVPLDVPTSGESSRPSIVLVLEPRGMGLDAVRTRCLLVSGLKLTLDDGRRLLAAYRDGGPIAGVEIPEPGPDYRTCRQLME